MLDGGATHHVTNDANSLSNLTIYTRFDVVLVENGGKALIYLTGSTIMSNNSSNQLHLNKVLHVLAMTTKLVFAHKLY